MHKVCGECYGRDRHAPTCSRAIPASLVRAAMGREQAEDTEPAIMACLTPAEPAPYDLRGALERLQLVATYARKREGRHHA